MCQRGRPPLYAVLHCSIPYLPFLLLPLIRPNCIPSKPASPACLLFSLEDINYSLTAGNETSSEVLNVVNQLTSQSLWYGKNLSGLKLKISSKVDVFEFDLEVMFLAGLGVVVATALKGFLLSSLAPHLPCPMPGSCVRDHQCCGCGVMVAPNLP